MANMTDEIGRKTFVGENSASQCLFYSFITITTIILSLLILLLLLLLSHTRVCVLAEPSNFPSNVVPPLTTDSVLRPLSSISIVLVFFKSHAQSSDSGHYSPGKYKHMFTHSAMLHLND